VSTTALRPTVDGRSSPMDRGSLRRRHAASASGQWIEPSTHWHYALQRGETPRHCSEKEPYNESLDLSRVVILDSVPGNAESWLCARAFELAAAAGIRGIVAFSDLMLAP
jgi:hypothetical protein